MRGQVLGVDRRTGQGQVAGDDGRRYVFEPQDWADRGEPRVGAIVDFAPEAERALSLFAVPGTPGAVVAPPRAPTSDHNKYVAALLAFFLGVFGIHRFYLGRTGSGVVMLILTITVIGSIVSVPWALIDTLRYLFMSEREFAARYDWPLR